ncbi:MAG: 5-aminolevulinate synthase, partial [Pseudomonadota bacterium]
YFKDAVGRVRTEGRYRIFAPLERTAYTRAKHHGLHGNRQVTIWCSNDYLGMSQNELVINALCETAQKYGAGAGGTRNIAGNSILHVQLEEKLARLHGKQAALLFTSGYIANEATLSTLASILPNCTIYSDADNHASIIAGIRNARTKKHVFRHNDMAHLEELLTQAPDDATKLIACESLYSMDGDVAPLKDICDLADKYNALTYVDEVHAVGLYGASGAGKAEELGIAERISIIQGTLAKAFGLGGGYISGDRVIIDAIRCFAPGFIFTTAMTLPIAAAALTSVQHVSQTHSLRIRHQSQVAKVKQGLQDRGLPLMTCSTTHIVPVFVGDPVKCKQITDILQNEFAIYVQPINYPTVPKGTERMRITPGPHHDDASIAHLLESLDAIWQRFDLPTLA